MRKKANIILIGILISCFYRASLAGSFKFQSCQSDSVVVDTISTVGQQKIGQKAIFRAPNGNTYEITTEDPIQGTEKGIMDCTTDVFHGEARKKPKTSMVTGPKEPFTNLLTFLNQLVPDTVMLANKTLKKNPNQRVQKEKRNIALSNVFLYAIKREPDNDFHMIIGDEFGNFFNTENTGLLASSPKILKVVRAKILAFFGPFCKSKYQLFRPGIPIEIVGSMFYDTEHAPGIVGPESARPKTAWELHPIIDIVFK